MRENGYKLKNPFSGWAGEQKIRRGSPVREAARTISSLYKKLRKFFKNLDTSKVSPEFIKLITPKPKIPPKRNISGLKYSGQRRLF